MRWGQQSKCRVGHGKSKPEMGGDCPQFSGHSMSKLGRGIGLITTIFSK